jgi:hypothetical protein
MNSKIFTLSIITIMITVLSGATVLAGEDIIFEKTLSSQSGAKLTVKSAAGTVKVISSSSNEVSVKAFGNDEAKEKLDISAEPNSDGVLVTVKKKEGVKMNNMNIRLEITVPAEYNVSLNTGGGNLSVTSLKGKMELNTKGGNITFDNNNGEANISTNGGNISVSSFSGSIEAETYGGNIKFSGSNGKVKATTMGGNISADYSGKNEGIELSTMAGNIKLEIPAEFDADVDLSTTVGRITGDLAKDCSEKRVGCTLQTTYGSGGNVLKCSTNAGTITVNTKK